MRSQPSLGLVIAHYNEDLSWLEEEIKSCAIYSKGGKENAPPYPHHTIPNIGREGQTYLHHIIERYDSLPDVTIFLQGRIDDHINLSLSEIKERALKTQVGQVTTFPFRDLELFDQWDGIPWEDYPSWKKWSSMKRVNAAKTPAQYWQTFFPGRKVPASIGFQPAALFAVRKETIQQHSRDFYRLLQEEFFLGHMAHVNPETGHHMERFWLAIWDPSEYICWDAKKDVARVKRNRQGQLAKGRWHVTPKHVDLDVYTLPPVATQYVTLGLDLITQYLHRKLHRLQTPPTSDDDCS